MKRIRDRRRPFFQCRHCAKEFIKGEHTAAKYCSLDCALWSRVDKRGVDECWPWTAAKVTAGYGHFHYNGLKRAPRVAYEVTNGPLGSLMACHSCDNPVCCNPSHLFAGTQADNMKDARDKGRTKMVFTNERMRGSANPRTNLTEDDVLKIRKAYTEGTGRRISRIGRDFGITRTACSAIIRRLTWKHV